MTKIYKNSKGLDGNIIQFKYNEMEIAFIEANYNDYIKININF
jgi:hypothetical protein